MSPFVIRLVGLVNGAEFALPVFLADYDPGAGNGTGLIRLTSDPARALRFPSLEEALACYRQVAPEPYAVRRDGAPNRPLTAYTVEVLHAEEVPA